MTNSQNKEVFWFNLVSPRLPFSPSYLFFCRPLFILVEVLPLKRSVLRSDGLLRTVRTLEMESTVAWLSLYWKDPGRWTDWPKPQILVEPALKSPPGMPTLLSTSLSILPLCNEVVHMFFLCLPRWLRDKESACQSKKHKKCGFDPWVRKIPWHRKWQPTPVSCLENSMDRGA